MDFFVKDSGRILRTSPKDVTLSTFSSASFESANREQPYLTLV